MLTPYLSTREVLTVGAGLLLAWYVASSLAAIYRLRHIPGPFFARFSYLPHLYILCTGQVKTAYQGMHDRLAGGGPFVTIAPGVVVTNDPDVLRRIGSARSPYRRHDWYRAARFHHEYENTGCIVDNEAHVKAKAKTASGYSGREVGAEFEPAIDAVIEDLVDLIRRKYLSGGAAGGEEEGEEKAADVSILIRLFTVDVITRLGYGRSFGHLDEGTDRYGFLEDASRSLVANSLIMEIPLLRWLVFGKVGLLGLLGPRETDKSGAGKIMGLIHQIVSDRFKEDLKTAKWNDMIGGFIRNGLTQREVEGEANLQVFAGSETTAVALSGTVMHLATSPRAYSRLKREIRDAVAQGKVDGDNNNNNNKPVTYEAAQKLEYLQAVLWEGFRLCVPVNIGHYKVVPEGGDTLAGYYLPPGTAVGHNSLALARNKRVFGADVEAFRPERFLEGDRQQREARVRALEIVFGGGRWTCSGKTVAFFELNKVTFELMRRFDFQVVNPRHAWDEAHYLMPQVSNMMVKITEADPDL